MKISQFIENCSNKFPRHVAAMNFLEIKPQIDDSVLKTIFKKMPKGAALHEHNGAINNFKLLIAD